LPMMQKSKICSVNFGKSGSRL